MDDNTSYETQEDTIDPAMPRRKRLRRGIYLLPNLFTTAGLFAGFYSIVAAMGGHFRAAAIAIFGAMIMDGLDGRIARLTHTQSDFGQEYDSLADLVSFGLAPALVMYQWAFKSMTIYGWAWAKLGWLGAFFFAVAGALRLARFNTNVHLVDKNFFQGLPSPSAAGLVAGAVWLGPNLDIPGRDLLFPAYILTICAAALMVSNVRYYSFKTIDLSGRVRFTTILLVPLILILIALSPPKVLFAGFFLYTCSGPVGALWRRRARAARRRSSRRKR